MDLERIVKEAVNETLALDSEGLPYIGITSRYSYEKAIDELSSAIIEQDPFCKTMNITELTKYGTHLFVKNMPEFRELIGRDIARATKAKCKGK